MRNPTEMMAAILTNDMAQKIIDYVSPIYGNSYIALWIYQAIGVSIDRLYNISVALRDEVSPATTDLLLGYWESQYGIPYDSSLTNDQRRYNLLTKIRFRAPYNPSIIANAISAAFGGIPVEIKENVERNTFLVNIREPVESINPAVAILERMKPAHLIYKIRVATQSIADADIKIAVAVTRSERFNVEVLQK